MIIRSTLKSIRYRPVRLVGTFVAFAVTLASMLALISILVGTTRNPGPPVLFHNSDIAVQIESVGDFRHSQDLTSSSIDLRINDEIVTEIEGIAGVESVTGLSLQDMSIRGNDGSVVPLNVVGSSSHSLNAVRLSSGDWAEDANQIVISDDVANRLQVSPGDDVVVSMPTGPVTMNIVGTLESRTGLNQVAVASHHSLPEPGSQFALIQLVDGADPASVADAIRSLGGNETYRVLTGDEIARIDPMAGASELMEFGSLLGVMAGFMGMVSIFVMLSTTGFAIQQRHGQIAIERAVGYTPNQVRKAVVFEGLLVALAGSVVGYLTSIPIVSLCMRIARERDLVPDGFDTGVDPLVTIILIPSMVLAVVIVSWWASRRTLDIAPVAAMREAKGPQTRVGLRRWVLGLLLIASAVIAVASSAVIPPILAMVFSLFVIIFAVWGISLIGQPIIRGYTRLGRPFARFGDPVAGTLALTNTHRMATRVASGLSPVMLGAGFLIMMFAFTATMQQGTIEVSADREQADYVVLPLYGSIPAGTVDHLSSIDGIDQASPMYTADLTTQPMSDTDVDLEVPGFAVNRDAFLATTSLKVSSGSLDDWVPGSILVSSMTSFDTSLDAGKPADVVMPDGSVQRFRVAAIVENTTGSGGIFYHASDLISLTENHGPAQVGITLDDNAGIEDVQPEIEKLNDAGYNIQMVSRDDYLAGMEQSMSDSDWATYLIIGSSAALGMIASINTLAMSTLERSREFSSMRLIGATKKQVMRVAAREGVLIGVFGVGVGILLALGSAASVSMALTGNIWAIRVPVVPAALAGAVAFVACVGSLYLPAMLSLRKNPLLEAGLRD